MKEKSQRIIDWVKEHSYVPGCTISKSISDKHMTLFVLSENTDISAEIHPVVKWIYVLSGSMILQHDDQKSVIQAGEAIRIDAHTLLGLETKEGCSYLEITQEEEKMNKNISSEQIFSLAELLPYQEASIVNMDLINTRNFKMVLMSFDQGCKLDEHAAPGEAIVMALDGQATLKYEGKEYTLEKGQSFKFDKMGKHAIEAITPFKMALFLELEA